MPNGNRRQMMRSSILPDLSLDCRFPSKACSRKSIGEIFAQVSRNHGVSEKILKLQDNVNRLRDEMKKIDAFKRELPLCMLLLNEAIVAAEEELALHKKSIAVPRAAAEEEVKQPAKDNVFQSIKNRTVVPLKGCMNFPVKRDELLPVPALSLCTPELKDPRDMINSIGPTFLALYQWEHWKAKATTFKYAFDYKPSDIYWCTADCGWINGHSYITYGPLLNGETFVVFEGTNSWRTGWPTVYIVEIQALGGIYSVLEAEARYR
ncbi:acetyl-coenzyme a synthetase chloroplastic/glyoxysomal [Phtheirospermum japonicum]|uniref:Acetyl-coenzyme a synthetase chloroplastic/glyoxysomal n=1 Tax=Phtheirospermum japonicum TaxID=374723 RepID=A0A830D0L5_9LAMI|nr:acetyl-coenzyme a synthetase chloroplastic/glyoxysomal [Phtheirospermum japonicum]